jgi:glycosyltransferase involved in cell wall biosynthesis
VKKILVLSHISELLGGAERSILEVLDIWEKEYGLKPEFILRNPVGTLGPEIKKRGWKYYSLDYTFWSESQPPKTLDRKYCADIQNTKAVLKIEDIIKKSKPDLVLTNSIVCPWAAIAAYYQKVPHVWFAREYGDLDHGRQFDMTREQTFQDIGLMSRLVITNSLALNKHVVKYVPDNKVTTLYHPFDIKKINKKSYAKVTNPFLYEDSLKLVLTGNVAESKGHREIIQAVSEMNKEGHNTELCIVGSKGSPAFMKELKKIAVGNSAVDKIHFIGFKKNPMPYVRLADLGVMSSRMEAFGRVTFEYIALGKPVVGVNAGATPEIVKDGQNGYLFDFGDTLGIKNALSNYLNNKTLLKKHGDNSIKIAHGLMASKYNVTNLYKEVIRSIKTKDYPEPLNFSHKWLAYPSTIDDYLSDISVVSVKKLFIKRLKNKVREYLDRLKATYRRLFR